LNIEIIDNFYNYKNLNETLICSTDYYWKLFRKDTIDDLYWTIHVYGDTYDPDNPKLKIDNRNKFQEVQTLWNEFSNKFNVPLENLESCYLNGITHGLEAFAHTDSVKDGNTTVILYLCEDWNLHWGGETVFFDQEFVKNNPAHEVFYNANIIKSILPKYNRVVLFDSHIMHAVRPISKSFKGLRKTLMFKLKNISVQQLMGNYKCN
jgi:hypothetical protein